MQNNLENKAKFFAQYWGQKVVEYKKSSHPQPMTVRSNTILCSNEETSHLLLKPLSSITDEDAIEIAELIYLNLSNWSKKEIIKFGSDAINDLFTNNFSFYKSLEIIDYLRSKGYALPYMGLSVEKQIEYGWVKLVD